MRPTFRPGTGAVAWGSFIALGVLVDGNWPDSVLPAVFAAYLLLRGAHLMTREARRGAEHPGQ